MALTSPEGGRDAGPLVDLCRRVTLVPRPGRLRGMAQRAVGLGWGRPWEVSRFVSRAMKRAVATPVRVKDERAGARAVR